MIKDVSLLSLHPITKIVLIDEDDFRNSFIISVLIVIFISQNFYIYFHIIKYFSGTVSRVFNCQALVFPRGSNGNKKLNNAKPPNDAAHT
jgi:hypothetical protein